MINRYSQGDVHTKEYIVSVRQSHITVSKYIKYIKAPIGTIMWAR